MLSYRGNDTKTPYILLAIFLTSLFLMSAPTAWATTEKKTFTPETFKQLQSEGKMILVDIYADWCSTCKKQQKAIKQYFEKHPERELHVLVVDFDKQKEMVAMLGAPRQSTLLLFKGNKQFWYSVAESRYEVIAEKIEYAFNFIPKR